MQGTSPTLLVTWWRLAYWYGFAVQFTVLPFHQEYADSGHFTISDRISTAIRNNLIFYAVLVVSMLLLLHPVSLAIPTSNSLSHACHCFLFSKCIVACCDCSGCSDRVIADYMNIFSHVLIHMVDRCGSLHMFP